MSTPASSALKYLALACLAVTLALLWLGRGAEAGPFVVACLSLLALYAMGKRALKSYAFTVWVFAFVAASMYYPAAFGVWFGFDLAILIVPLIQIIMFGMGTTLSLRDFARVMKMPWPVFIGIALQFSVMPFAGLGIALAFGFEPEIAAGVVLIGSCSGGVASNLMTYLARGNVALSVTMTACSTMMSPLVTPLLMDRLAGRFVPIDPIDMMFSILNLIVVPVVAGLLANRILYGKAAWESRALPLAAGTLLCAALAIGALVADPSGLGRLATLRNGLVIGAALIALVCLAKLVVNLLLRGPENWMDRALPIVSMAGICYIIAIITARSADKLLTVGVALVSAAILHNAIGYVLGYWIGKGARLDERSCRTIAFEVGMQNGGMASALAMNVLNSASAALAPAIFGPWMNISGSVLATWWHGRTKADDRER